MNKQTLFCKTTILKMLKEREPLFGGWNIVDYLGAGQYGCVYKMERMDMGQRFVSALKVMTLTKSIEQSRGSIQDLQKSMLNEAREITHMYSLGMHQNVVGWHNHEIYQDVEEDVATTLVAVMMEYLPNSLTASIRKGPMQWQAALKIIIDCLQGLEYVHSKRILHRDIKPDNIFITRDGIAKIGDFGVARKMDKATFADTRVGTPLYIAPEVVKDPYGEGYGYSIDIYSLGIVAHEMLTGILPFAIECNGNKQQMVKYRLSGRPIIIKRPLPPGVVQAIQCALAYDPGLRYSSATEFRKALERCLETRGQETIRPKNAIGVNQNYLGGSESSGISGPAPGYQHDPQPHFTPYEDSQSIIDAYRDFFAPYKEQREHMQERLVIFLAAALISFAMAKLHFNTMLYSVGFLISYIGVPLYFMFKMRMHAIYTPIVFTLSLLAEDIIYTTPASFNLEDLRATMGMNDISLLALYLVSMLLIPFLAVVIKEKAFGDE